MRSVLWYVHDHGRGHLERARAVLRHVQAPVVVAAGPGISGEARRLLDRRVLALPPDTVDGRAAPRGPWHHAPAAPVQRRRMSSLAAAARAHGCATAVVDVSMEVATFTALLGLRTVALRQSGRRDDPAHRIGFGSADYVWVPQHPDLEPIDGPIDARWRFTGAFSRYDRPRLADGVSRSRRTAVFVLGRGGTDFDEARWRMAAPPDGWRIVIAGTATPWQHGDVAALGHVDSLAPWLADAEVVVTSAGWASVADAAALRRRLVVIPEDRPFDEQAVRAGALAAAGLARSLPAWPDPVDLGAVLDDAAALEPDAWDRYYDGGGAQRAAALIDEAHAA